jgi:dTDP-4-dehydrorhamnose reductase
LVSGASGLLGTTLAPFLAGAGYDIVRQGRSDARSDVSWDLTDRDVTVRLLRKISPDIVVNLVAQTNVDRCEEDPQGAYLLNVRTAENLVAGLRDRTNAHLVHISTDQVYDSPGPSREQDVRLTNTYALTKYAGELASALMPSTILRTNFFGHSLLPGRSSFSDWLLTSLRNRDPITVFSDAVISPLSMGTLCEMIGRVIETPIKGIFNLGSRGFLSKADFAFEVARIYGLATNNVKRGLCSDLGLPAYRPKDMAMDCSRFEAAFNVVLPEIEDEIRSLRRSSDAIA